MKEREREREHSERALLSKQSANDIEEIALLMRVRRFFQCCRHKMSASAPFQKQKASDDQTSAINKSRTPHLLSLYLLLLFLEDEEKNRDLYVYKYIKVECALFFCLMWGSKLWQQTTSLDFFFSWNGPTYIHTLKHKKMEGSCKKRLFTKKLSAKKLFRDSQYFIGENRGRLVWKLRGKSTFDAI